MKKSKWLALAGVALLSVGALAACSSKSSTSGTTYGYIYNSDPETLTISRQILDLRQLL